MILFNLPSCLFPRFFVHKCYWFPPEAAMCGRINSMQLKFQHPCLQPNYTSALRQVAPPPPSPGLNLPTDRRQGLWPHTISVSPLVATWDGVWLCGLSCGRDCSKARGTGRMQSDDQGQRRSGLAAVPIDEFLTPRSQIFPGCWSSWSQDTACPPPTTHHFIQVPHPHPQGRL